MSTEGQQVTIDFQEKALFFGVWRSCLNCHHWKPNAIAKAFKDTKGEIHESHEICNKFRVRPPLKVIVVSCPEWLPHVPF